MERERLTQLVEEPGNVGRADMSDLTALAERYPWFAGAQVLRSLGEYKSGDVLSEETLRDASAHVPSRAVLFDLIAGAASVAQPTLTVVPKADVTGMEVREPDPASGVVAQPVVPAETSAPTLREVEIEGGTIPSAPEPEPDPLERQILESALASAYDLTWLERTVSGPSDPVLPEGSGAPVVNELPVARIEPVRSVPPQELRPVVQKGARLRFTAWLDEGTLIPDVTVPRPAMDQHIPDVASDWLRKGPEIALSEPVTDEPVKPAAVLAPTDTRSIIDRFINQQPLAAPKVGFYTPQQAAKRSLDDTAGLVTETLARVYEKQGNLPKAIDAYRRLALKYPAKSAYFAALAKELEGQLNK